MSTTQVDLICRNCGQPFQISKKEHTRQVKNGRIKDDFFCCISCASKWNNAHLTMDQKKKSGERLQNWCKENGFHNAKKGKFTYYLNKMRSRSRRKNVYNWDLDEEYLNQIWNSQNGKCALTNIPIIIRNYDYSGRVKPNTASLDRIDSSLGYIKGNVQFVAYSINVAKSDFDNQEFIAFLREVVSAF